MYTSMDTTRSQPTRPCISFLDLPREIRDSIYHLALHRSVSLRPVGKISYFCNTYGHLQQRETCVSISSPPFDPATPLAISVFKLLNPGLPLELLRLNKQVHEEAAEALYGGNHFQFIIGPTARVRQILLPSDGDQNYICGDRFCWIHRKHYKCYPGSYNRSHFMYEDNLFDLPSRYLKLIKRCDIHVQMPAIPDREESQLYISIQTSLGNFAARFGGPQHSLRDVLVLLNQPRTDVIPDARLREPWARHLASLWKRELCFDHDRLTQKIAFMWAPIKRAENVLEPLGTIFGARTVGVVGASSDMAAKLSGAMTSSRLACVPKEERYGTRRAQMIRRRRKKETQRYKLGKFYETKFDWGDQILN